MACDREVRVLERVDVIVDLWFACQWCSLLLLLLLVVNHFFDSQDFSLEALVKLLLSHFLSLTEIALPTG